MKHSGRHEGLYQGHGADTNRADHACASKLMDDWVRAPCTQGARGFSCAVCGFCQVFLLMHVFDLRPKTCWPVAATLFAYVECGTQSRLLVVNCFKFHWIVVYFMYLLWGITFQGLFSNTNLNSLFLDDNIIDQRIFCSIFFISLAVSIKMNILLFAPGLLLLLFKSLGVWWTIPRLALCAVVQVRKIL